MLRAIPILLFLFPSGPAVCADGDWNLEIERQRLERLTEAAAAALRNGIGPQTRTLEELRRAIERLVDGNIEAAVRARPHWMEAERLVHAILSGTLLLHRDGQPPPSGGVVRLVDWLHLESPWFYFTHEVRSFVQDTSWYGRYLTSRSRGIAARLGSVREPGASHLIRWMLAHTPRASWNPLFLAGLAHPQASVRLLAVDMVMLRTYPSTGGARHRPRYDGNEAVQRRVAELWEKDPAIAHYLERERLPSFQEPMLARLLRLSDLAAEPARRVEQALDALSVPEPRYRLRSLEAMENRSESSGVAAFRARLLEMLREDPSEPVRWAAARIVFARRDADPEFLPALVWSVHDDPSPAVRRAIAGLLDPLAPGDGRVRLALSRAYVQGRLPERNEWNCVDVFRF